MKQNTAVYNSSVLITLKHDEEWSGQTLTDCCGNCLYMFSRVIVKHYPDSVERLIQAVTGLSSSFFFFFHFFKQHIATACCI